MKAADFVSRGSRRLIRREILKGYVAHADPAALTDRDLVGGVRALVKDREEPQAVARLVVEQVERVVEQEVAVQKRMTRDCRVFAQVRKNDEGEEERTALIEVMVAGERDTQGDRATAPQVRKAAHNFMLESQRSDDMHDGRTVEGIKTLQSAVTTGKMEVLDPDTGELLHTMQPDTWFVTLGIFDDDKWAEVKRGKRTGVSIGGTVNYTNVGAA